MSLNRGENRGENRRELSHSKSQMHAVIVIEEKNEIVKWRKERESAECDTPVAEILVVVVTASVAVVVEKRE